MRQDGTVRRAQGTSTAGRRWLEEVLPAGMGLSSLQVVNSKAVALRGIQDSAGTYRMPSPGLQYGARAAANSMPVFYYSKYY